MNRTDARGHKIRIDVILNETVHNFVMNRKVLIKNIRRKCNPKIETWKCHWKNGEKTYPKSTKRLMCCWPNYPWLAGPLYRLTIPRDCYLNSMWSLPVLCWTHHFPIGQFCYFANSGCANYSNHQKHVPRCAVFR